MQYRAYGKLGWEVSLLGLGCMRLPRILGEDGSTEVDREKAYELIRYAVQNGINYFDTAYAYHDRQSEAILGEALDGGLRQKVRIATKQPFSVMTDQRAIRANLEDALKKLRTDYIDVYMIHNIQAGDWDAIKRRKIIEEYEKFKAEGLIKAIAFSYHGGLATFQKVLGYCDWDMCQVQQNLLDVDREVTAEGLREAGKKGCAIVIMEPLRGGGLAGAPPHVQAVYDQAAVRRSPVEWAFRHLYDFPQISTILSGMTTMEQLKDNIRIFSQPDALPGALSPEERSVLARAKAAYESVITVPCTMCEYCMPCPQGVNIPGVFSRYNTAMMFQNYNNARRTYKYLEKMGQDAAQCVGCGLCEPQCPQHIAIIRELKTAREVLEGEYE